MEHLGDITKLKGSDLPVVDCVIGGSPCQDLSVAGKRAGLSGERSGLFVEQIRIVKEMREIDKARGRTGVDVRPRFMVWENVPGAFTSNKGADFWAVLEETVRVADPTAVVPGPPGGKWEKAGAIVGEGYSLAWRQLDAQFWGVPQRRKRISLVADFGGECAPEIQFESEGLRWNPGTCEAQGEGPSGNPADCSGERLQVPYGIGSYHSNSWVSGNPDSGVYLADTAKTLDAITCGYPACNQGDIAVVVLNDQGGHSINVESGETAPTLRAEAHGNIPVVCLESNQNHARATCDGVAPTLPASMGMWGGYVPMVCFDMQHHCDVIRECGDKTPTLASTMGMGGGNIPIVIRPEDLVVRRLTPLECERLQGYPDGWTDIGDWIDGNGKKHKGDADSARYKALGNSIAVPCWAHILHGISKRCSGVPLMASLFDGIGGFPLLWEAINGSGTAVWASEIEEFPIAVTKARFPESWVEEWML